MFLSAEPAHWCHVSALHNLSESHRRALSIPRRDLGPDVDVVVYERCFQYDVNFTRLFHENEGRWPEVANDTWPTTKCKEGWEYDQSEYQNTLVTEVSLLTLVLEYFVLLG